MAQLVKIAENREHNIDPWNFFLLKATTLFRYIYIFPSINK
jgi:hypothetical protein